MLHIVLFRPEKPENTGNIIRTCVATGAILHIIGPITFSLETKDLKRVGLDYIERLNLVYYKDYEEFEKRHSEDLIFYVTRYAKNTYSNFVLSDSSKNIYLMFGRESTGIPHDILRNNPDKLMRIPMVSNARSLNLSNCVALVLYEALRQQKFPNLSTSEALKGEDFLFDELK